MITVDRNYTYSDEVIKHLTSPDFSELLSLPKEESFKLEDNQVILSQDELNDLLADNEKYKRLLEENKLEMDNELKIKDLSISTLVQIFESTNISYNNYLDNAVLNYTNRIGQLNNTLKLTQNNELKEFIYSELSYLEQQVNNLLTSKSVFNTLAAYVKDTNAVDIKTVVDEHNEIISEKTMNYYYFTDRDLNKILFTQIGEYDNKDKSSCSDLTVMKNIINNSINSIHSIILEFEQSREDQIYTLSDEFISSTKDKINSITGYINCIISGNEVLKNDVISTNTNKLLLLDNFYKNQLLTIISNVTENKFRTIRDQESFINVIDIYRDTFDNLKQVD